MQLDLRALCERYDPQSRPVYLSLYADFSDPAHTAELERRQQEIAASLPQALEREELGRLWQAARDACAQAKAQQGTRGAAVFAGPEGWVEAHGLHEPIRTRLVLDSSPYVRPLARFVDDHESFAVVLLDSEQAALFTVAAGKPELEGEASTSLIGRHRSGGMSQMRYQRHRQGQVNQFYDGVAERLAGVVRRDGLQRVLVAGPGTAKKEFAARLPKELSSKVVAVEDADFKDGPVDDALLRRFVALMRDEEAKESKARVAALRRELHSGELATTGALPVCREAAAGRVECLVVLRGAAVPGSKCEEHQEVFPRSAACHCGNGGADVDLVNEAVEFTVRAGGAWEFVDPPEPFLEAVGGIGALLRW